jgi:hypothetical protein
MPVIVNQKSDEGFLSRATIGSDGSLFISEKEICLEESAAAGDEGSRGDYNLFQTEGSKQMSPLPVLTVERGVTLWLETSNRTYAAACGC